MAETMDKIIVIVGYLLAIFIPILGLIAGIVLYFVKKEDPFYQKHAKYIIIVAIVVWVLSAILIGMMGAGKTTTIKMMTGILTPSSGTVTVNGLIPYENREENAKNIGVVFGQKTQLWWDLPISETFSLLKDIYEVSDEDFEERMKFLNNGVVQNKITFSSSYYCWNLLPKQIIMEKLEIGRVNR